MCGGIAFPVEKISDEALKSSFPDDKVKRFRERGLATAFFWDPEPVLPIEEGKSVILCQWGNRAKEVKLPKTGWAREESLNEGRWRWLKPSEVKIPATQGYEKGKWFKIPKGIKGVRVDHDGKCVVYMVTRPASPKYLNLTSHNRMPVAL